MTNFCIMQYKQDIPPHEGLSATEKLAIRLTELAKEYIAFRDLYEKLDETDKNKIFTPGAQEDLSAELDSIHRSLLRITKCFPK